MPQYHHQLFAVHRLMYSREVLQSATVKILPFMISCIPSEKCSQESHSCIASEHLDKIPFSYTLSYCFSFQTEGRKLCSSSSFYLSELIFLDHVSPALSHLHVFTLKYSKKRLFLVMEQVFLSTEKIIQYWANLACALIEILLMLLLLGAPRLSDGLITTHSCFPRDGTFM